MSATLEFKYRIIYESLSRFSSALSRSATLEEVTHCLRRQVKYLFDYQLIRFCFYQRGHYIVYSLASTDCRLQCGEGGLLWAHERILKSSDVPSLINDQTLIAEGLQQLTLRLLETPTQIWGWNVGFSPESGMVVSVFSDSGRQFQPADIPILKIALENLYAKLLSIQLIEELGESKKVVEQALVGLQEKSAVIARLVNTQEETIQRRTRELEAKNAQLLQLSRQHAHLIREPLSRILSMAYLIEVLPPQEVTDEIIPLLVITAHDLDLALQQVIQHIDNEISPLG